ncbi:hypothetical protein Airi01_092310 [Actinoallomurus iriomotensis]|uniref:Uncharacterized protein n=1 Tax=Actinoallomurus iriomotensis TaxID=478107 RepID=A0A9W6VV90_9ACTN|nr:hypothetical protein Airi01_092310 [Actinoallomurus iriomotensis]
MARAYADPLLADAAYEVVLALDQQEEDVGQNGLIGGDHGSILPAGTDSFRGKIPGQRPIGPRATGAAGGPVVRCGS